MKVLFIGGNGNISWHCVNEALRVGHEVWAINREASVSTRKPFPSAVNKIKGDIREPSVDKILFENTCFDVVCDFICYNQLQAENAVRLFSGRVAQYIYISSEAIYQRVSKNLPYKETSEKYEPSEVCDYIAGKILAERTFINAYEDRGFPATIVRPSYVYDTILPASIGNNCFTPFQRIINGQPVLMAGDGNNLWTFMHARDFANAFVHLIGNKKSLGEDYHIATDEWLTWNEMTVLLLAALGVNTAKYIHIPFDMLMKTELGQKQKDMLFQKTWHNIYDISKIKDVAPGWKPEILFEDGIRKTIDWLYEDGVHRRIDPNLDRLLDEISNMLEG